MENETQENRGTIVAFISELMMSTQVKKVSEHLGYRTQFLEDTAVNFDPVPASQEPPAEPLFGREASLIETITSLQPVLLIFDLSNSAIPWRNWIAMFKSSPATRRIPILCFSPHLDTASINDARSKKADKVVARSRFVSHMPQLIEETSRQDNGEAIRASCQDLISSVALEGLKAFNEGHYFDAHEYLEEAWMEDTGAARDVYRAVLQISVAFLQIERRNYRGAVKMFLRARQWLSRLPDVCRGINIALLRKDANESYQRLVKLGPDNINKFDRTKFPSLDYSRIA